MNARVANIDQVNMASTVLP